MSAAFTSSGRIGRRGAPARYTWERLAPWVAPLLIAGLLAACTYFMFASQGASLI
jgi:hypothetical protein